MQKSKRLSIGFTSYRPETLDFARQKMLDHEAIFLEEPETPGFEEMLLGQLSIEDYLQLTDFEFPEYAERSCKLYQKMHSLGKKVLQIDPYMDELVRIHEFFAAEGSPEQITPGTVTRKVYECEREWTKRLITFYRRSGSKEFERIVSAVKEFAKMDAQKGSIRNRMRAERIADLFKDYGSIYIEAGYIHIQLMQEILRLIPKEACFHPHYLMEPIFRQLAGRRRILGPGDILTLIYAFRPKYSRPKADLLAAQSLIYNKIVQKEEISEDPLNFPHTRKEIQAISLASSLNYQQCKRIFYELKPFKTKEAKDHVQNFVSKL